MPFDPDLLIPIFLFTFLFLLASRAIKYKHERRKWEVTKHREPDDHSLTTSELQNMIQEAVAEATSSLEARLERLEMPRLEESNEDPPVSKSIGRERTH